MSSQVKSVRIKRPARVRQSHRAADANCLLCRILWPTVVAHRHLLFDDLREYESPTRQRALPN
jgi:hypothetical protein